MSSQSVSKSAEAALTKNCDCAVGKGTGVGFNSIVGKRLLNVTEAAHYLGLQVETIYKKARLRELPFVKVGRALRFDVVALGRYIAEHTVETID
jgi:excisionase family DNA binding protein